MEPIKFEKFIKNRLEERTIQPSANAWDTLESRLNENEKTSSNKSYWWLAIAASFIGILFTVTLMTNSNESENNTPVIVETEPLEENDSSTTSVDSEIESVEKKEVQKTETPIQRTDKVQGQIVNSQSKVQPEIIKADVMETSVAENRTTDQKRLSLNTSEVETKVTFEEQKVNDVVEQIKALQKANKSVSEQEIIALLVAAQKEIAQNKIYDSSSNTVNADALLQEVENDLDESFRSRVFKALHSGYENVKTAVAERNN